MFAAYEECSFLALGFRRADAFSSSLECHRLTEMCVSNICVTFGMWDASFSITQLWSRKGGESTRNAKALSPPPLCPSAQPCPIQNPVFTGRSDTDDPSLGTHQET